jgi:tetratricopeptide (TPR) repeat protein
MAPPALKAALPLVVLFTTLSSSAGALAGEPSAPDKDSDNRQYARRGVDSLMDGDLDAAISIFRQVEQNDPQSPLGYLLEAEAIWWRIYYSTADLLDPDVFDVARSEASPEDSHFSDLINVAITRSEVRIRAHQDVARNTLYEGMAYALEGRLTGLRGKDLAMTRSAKKMRTLLLSALKMDPNLTDAYLGLGIYNYFIDTLPPAIKVLKFFANVPGGNRAQGLRQIRQASEQGELTRDEAKFYLAKDYSHDSEKKYKNSLELFHELSDESPHNPLWTLLSANMQARLGQTREADVLYREAFKKTGKINSEPAHAVHQAAREILSRQHPTEKFSD